jgi:hypothetical protein
MGFFDIVKCIEEFGKITRTLSQYTDHLSHKNRNDRIEPKIKSVDAPRKKLDVYPAPTAAVPA